MANSNIVTANDTLIETTNAYPSAISYLFKKPSIKIMPQKVVAVNTFSHSFHQNLLANIHDSQAGR